MSIHNDQVEHLLKLSETSFVSGGHDFHLILWRNGDYESQLRNEDALHSLRNSDIDFEFPETTPTEGDNNTTAANSNMSESETEEENTKKLNESRIELILVRRKKNSQRRNTFPFRESGKTITPKLLSSESSNASANNTNTTNEKAQ